jgi:transposase
MEEYIGLDVSMKETAVSIRRGGQRVWRGKCPSDPKLIADLIRKRAPSVTRVVFETGPLSVWFYHALCAEGLPAICIDARHAKAALDMTLVRNSDFGPVYPFAVGLKQCAGKPACPSGS